MKNAVEAVELTKSYAQSGGFWRKHKAVSRVDAVKNLSVTIPEGTFVGFLGPNGAGKSTTLKMLTGILHPTSGHVRVAGLSPQRDRTNLARRIGVVFGQRTQLWWDLPLQESFRILRAMYQVPPDEHRERLKRLDEWLELTAFMHTPVRQLSLGQRMRGELAAALLHQPEVLFLDEPTIGLDVSAKAAIRDFLRGYNRTTGSTVILTTHDMGDVEELCQRIVMIHHGRMRFDGTIEALHGQVGIPSALEVTFATAPNWEALQQIAGLACLATDKPLTVLAQFNRATLSAIEVLGRLSQVGSVRDFSLREPSLESVMERVYQDRNWMPPVPDG